MSAEDSKSDPWLSIGTYPAPDASGPEPPESEYPDERPPVPTPEERVAGLLAEYPDRMATPISEEHGRKLRESVLDDPDEEYRMVDVGSGETVEIPETVSRDAMPLLGAVVDLLETYEKYRDMHLRMVRDGRTIEREEFMLKLNNSFSPEYQSGTYAKLMALKRQLVGGEYPNGAECSGLFEDAVTVLFGLTASAYNVPGRRASGFRPSADHDREIRESWSGSSNSVKRVLRDVLERRLGLSSDEYAWWWQSEPHPGDGAAAGYSHSHPVVILDADAADVALEDIGAETFRPVVAKHVSLCEGATWDAHGLDDAVTVKKPNEIQDFGSYVSKYLALGPDQDLLERSDEYLMWAASQWATTTQKYSKSRTATAAVDADRCQQEYMDEEAEQSVCHGEEVVQSKKPGVRWECAECGSHYGIDQSEESLARMRLDATEALADGGEESEVPQTLEERWPSADGAVRVGEPVRERVCRHPDGSDQCPLCASETESPHHTVSGEVPIPDHAEAPPAEPIHEAFEREPQWEPDAVVRTWGDGEETAIGSPGGAVYAEVVVEGYGSITDQCDLPYLPQSSVFEGPEPWENTDVFDESDVRAGRVPPPELVAREWAESLQSGRRVTPKQWSDSWYADRFEQDHGPTLTELEEKRVRELVRVEGVESVPSICGRLQLDPSKTELVEALVSGC